MSARGYARRLRRLEGGANGGRCPACGWPPAPGEPIAYDVRYPPAPEDYDPADFEDTDDEMDDAPATGEASARAETASAPASVQPPEPEADEGEDRCPECGRSLVYRVRYPNRPNA